jgi:hypothetical protein
LVDLAGTFIFCLKGDNDKEYYDVLEINDSSRATAEIVKRQYNPSSKIENIAITAYELLQQSIIIIK